MPRLPIATADAFLDGRAARGPATFHTDGVRAWSYDTCVAEHGPAGVVYLNATRYSVTTARHVRALRAACLARGIVPVERKYIPIGTRSCRPLP